MTYSLFWRSPALPYTQKQTAISIPAGAVVSNAASIRFTGKGAANYGKIQQENQIRLLENFAGPTPPDYPTVGQTWYDTLTSTLKVCISTAPGPVLWRGMNGLQVTDVGMPPPVPAALGDLWYERTGSASGILYVYTGLGRYPQKDWSATSATYFPATSTTLGVKLNQSTFAAAANSNFDEAYIHGFSNGVAADVDGSITFNGGTVVVPKGQLCTQFPTDNAYVVWDRSNTELVSAVSGVHHFQVRQLADGTWQYDNNALWVSFVPTDNQLVIGRLTVSEQDDQSPDGITSMTLFAEARTLDQVVQVPMVQTKGAIGGWAQIHPTIDFGAGREEYDFMMGLLSQLIGDVLAFGGGGAIGKSIDYLSPMNTLDASLQDAWKAITPNDQNILLSESFLAQHKMDPDSQDWDRLLAAAKYAVERLDLPAGSTDDISDLPFVQDGRQVPPELAAKSGVQQPSTRRKANRRAGMFMLNRLFQETVNVMNAAVSNRYVLKGMLGNSGVHTSFAPNVSPLPHVTMYASAVGTPFSSYVSHGITFNFDYTNPERQRFFGAGQAIEIIVRHIPSSSPTTADNNLVSLTNSSGRFRITADSVYVMDTSVIPALTQPPGQYGAYSLTTGSTTMSSVSANGASLAIRGVYTGGASVQFVVDIKAGGATTGYLSVTWNLILDNEAVDGVRVYPKPLPFASADRVGSTSFDVTVPVVVTPPPPPPPPPPSSPIAIGNDTITVSTAETDDVGSKFSGFQFGNDGYIYAIKANSGFGATPTVTQNTVAGNWYIGKPISASTAGLYEVKFDFISGTAGQLDAQKKIGTGPATAGTWYNLGTTREFGREIWLKQAGPTQYTQLVFRATIRDVATQTTQTDATFVVNWDATRASNPYVASSGVRAADSSGIISVNEEFIVFFEVRGMVPYSSNTLSLNLTRPAGVTGGTTGTLTRTVNADALGMAEIAIWGFSSSTSGTKTFTYSLNGAPAQNVNATISPADRPDVIIMNSTVKAGTNTILFALSPSSGPVSSAVVTQNGTAVSTTLAWSKTPWKLSDQGTGYVGTATGPGGSDSEYVNLQVQPADFNIHPAPAMVYRNVGQSFTQTYYGQGSFDAPIGSMTVQSGSLPPGLSISGRTITGSFTTPGSYSAVVRCYPEADYCSAGTYGDMTVTFQVS